MIRILSASAALIIIAAVAGCGGSGQADEGTPEPAAEPTLGGLAIYANGEDFVREGFLSKDGWQITFRHLYVTVSDVTAYQTDPPYDPHTGDQPQSDVSVTLEGIHTVDLAEGGADAEPILVGSVESVPTGHYNAMSWKMVPAVDGPSAGYSIFIDAQAERGDQSYIVRLGVDNAYEYCAGEYVGDQRKGFVSEGETGDLEMTFHFDHIFGDGQLPEDDELNAMAVGFQPFAELMQEGTVDEDLTSLSAKLPLEDYEKLASVLATLGHTGEGHCSCTVLP